MENKRSNMMKSGVIFFLLCVMVSVNGFCVPEDIDIDYIRLKPESPHDVCKTENITPYEPMDCENTFKKSSTRMLNGIAYLECSFDTLSSKDVENEIKRDRRFVRGCREHRLTCCMLSYMWNLEGKSPKNQPFQCYSSQDMPTYRTPHKETSMLCKCYRDPFKVIDEDSLVKCHQQDTGKCVQHRLYSDGSWHSCICEHKKDDELRSVQSCSDIDYM